MTNLEKLRETFPKTIFIFRKNGNDETAAIMVSDEWLQGDYDQMYKDSEPCEDTISRKHLLSEIDDLMKSPWFNNGKDDDMFTHYGYVERKEAVEVVRDLCVKAEPPVTPKQRWIPVSERLPENRNLVLVTAYWHETYQVMVGSYWGNGVWWCAPWNNTSREHLKMLNAVAWMPLPEPYTEGVSE